MSDGVTKTDYSTGDQMIGRKNQDEPRLSLLSRLHFAMANRIHYGTFEVTVPEGVTRKCGGKEPGPNGPITLNNSRMVPRMILGGNVGLGESYLDGDWDSSNLADFLTVGAMNYEALDETLNGSMVYRVANRLIHHGFNSNSKRGSRKNIAHHYDLGNAFYERWLDPSMTYSSAQFDDVAGDREGLNDKVDIRLIDYRDLEGQFDHIASIEMFEAVGEKYWPVFFDGVRDRLKEGGRAALQIITIGDRHFDNYRRRPDFIQRYIFPGGMLPSPSALKMGAEAVGLSQISSEGFGLSYARTLSEWNDRFQKAWGEIAEIGFDNRFKRMWEYYLAYCEAGFRSGTVDVKRVTLAKV